MFKSDFNDLILILELTSNYIPYYNRSTLMILTDKNIIIMIIISPISSNFT